MTFTLLQQWIEHPENLNKDTLYELRTLVVRYPYFHSLRLLYLKNLYLLHDLSFGNELRKAVLFVPDRRMLFYLIEGDRYTLKPELSQHENLLSADEEPGLDRTLSLIDAFLSTVPKDENQVTGLDYSMDYTTYLLDEDKTETSTEKEEEKTPKLKGQDLIDGFIQRSLTVIPKKVEEHNDDDKIPPMLPVETKEPDEASDIIATTVESIDEVYESEEENDFEEEDSPEETRDSDDLDDSCFTETLARIYIKQQKYEKALEIIKKLSLNYPKKNAYFADQIRFLEKLIINAKSK